MPPVDPASPRYQRQRILPGVGPAGQEALAAAHVVVLGAGGLGSAVVPVLVAAGVGRVTIVDDDVVDETNLHRQVMHGPGDVGRAKVESAADAAEALSPETLLHPHAARFTEANADALLEDADVVVDGTDDIRTRYVADDAAARRGIPLVWGSSAKFSGQAGVSWEARGVAYRDLFPDAPAPDAVLSCDIDGILPSVCTVIGGLMAGEVLKLVTGIGEPMLGRVAAFDALSGRTREIVYRRAEEVPEGPAPERVEPAVTSHRERVAHDTLTARELADELARGHPLVLIDVREAWELDVARLDGAIHIPLGELATRVDELDREARIVAICHLGVRSQHALHVLDHAGFEDIRHLDGGIDAWSATVDPALPRY
ncbi:adenylyltransferase/sulfurtransferase MoeZ [Agromyces rhizosphaerae]|uniref:Adenylyltransferase/sulfurtransferase MoeZ n=1 Tax=Agromyces rhizosphaerae TaxID=88374 RepID=A0A9W6FNB0_9MICO|nr:ThiF family adenylyltransferase [Agromyces rhizosphaerae]GLI26311.1 adenylyltransferase/sulfurtransferase MoeZ [Agromyces rhizosphaerae]